MDPVLSLAAQPVQIDQKDVQRFTGLLRIKDRRRRMLLVKQCFRGSYTVDSLVASGMSIDRADAVALTQRIMDLGYIESCGERPEHRFEDSRDRLFRLVPLDQVRVRRRLARERAADLGADGEDGGMGQSLLGGSGPGDKAADAEGVFTKLLVTARYFMKVPLLWLLMVAGGIRYGAGYIWAQYSSLYYELEYGQSKTQVATYLGWVPLVGGLLGVLIGGMVADAAMARRGPWARVAIVCVSNFVATPFAVGSLVLAVPWAYLALIPKYMCSEMWMGVTLAVVLELVPVRIRATSVSVYLFAVSQIGGNSDLMVEPLQKMLGGSLKKALLVLFPGMYVLSAALFFVVMVMLRRRAGAELAAAPQELKRVDTDHDQHQKAQLDFFEAPLTTSSSAATIN